MGTEEKKQREEELKKKEEEYAKLLEAPQKPICEGCQFGSSNISGTATEVGLIQFLGEKCHARRERRFDDL